LQLCVQHEAGFYNVTQLAFVYVYNSRLAFTQRCKS
jgi:hypothetical protein